LRKIVISFPGGAGLVAAVLFEEPHERVVRKGLGVVSAFAAHVARGHHRVHDGFFGRLHGRFEQAVQVIVADELRLVQRRPGRSRGIGRRERDEKIARAVTRIAAHARQPHARALGDALELVRQQGRVSGDHDNDRTGVAMRAIAARPRKGRIGVDAVVAQGLADRDACDAQGVAHAVIGLHQHADGIGGLPLATDAARSSADAAFEFVAHHAGAAAHVAFRDGSAAGVLQGLRHMGGRDVEAVDVVEVPVPGFGDDRQGPPVTAGVGAAALTRPAITASRTTPTLCVLVSITGPSSWPDSSIQAVPVISPLPLSANQPPKTDVASVSRPRGRTAVTPVRILWPSARSSIRVTCPT
jgi:hypothetical protein